MSKQVITISITALLIAACVVPALAQVREKKLGATDYKTVAGKASQAFEAKKYVSCAKHLKQMIALCWQMASEELVAKRPAAPEGFEAVPVKKAKNTRNPYGLAGIVGHTAEYTYKKTDGQGNIRVAITADSTMAQMLEAQFKIASMNQDIEVVKYGEHKALFENKNGNLKLQILVHGLHYVEVQARGVDEDAFFGMFSQAFVDGVAAILT